MSSNFRQPEKYYEASLAVPRGIHDAVCNFIIENYAGGIILEEEEDSTEVGIKFYVPQSRGIAFREDLADYINRISANEFFAPEHIGLKTIINIEWEQAYKDSIKPAVIGNVIVRPPWVPASPGHNIELIIEPKMAFGTGTHETTRLCINAILKYFGAGQTFFDLGCGSGILSILAAKLGAASVRGVDIDLVAVQNALENIAINGVENLVIIEFGSIEKAGEGVFYDFLAANLIKSAIVELFSRINEAVAPGGIILLSGLLLQDEPAICELLTRNDILKYEINRDGQWLAFTVFKR